MNGSGTRESSVETGTTQTIVTFEIEFDGDPIMSIDLSVDVAELTVNNAVTKLQSEPVPRIEEIDLLDCEASVVVSGTLGKTIAELKLPLKGGIVLSGP